MTPCLVSTSIGRGTAPHLRARLLRLPPYCREKLLRIVFIVALGQVKMDFENDDWGDSSDDDGDWGDDSDDWKRKKREVNNKEESRLMEEKKEKDMMERKKREVVDNLETPLVPEEENRRVKRDAATKWKKGVQVWHISEMRDLRK